MDRDEKVKRFIRARYPIRFAAGNVSRQILAEVLETRTMLSLTPGPNFQAAVGSGVVATTVARGLELSPEIRHGISTPQYVAFDANPQLKSDGTLAPFSTTGPTGLSPTTVRHAYGVDQVMFGSVAGDGTGQTIAIVDAYDYPTASVDLHAFDIQFGLADPPSLTRVNETGGSTLPSVDSGAKGNDWEVEEALDVEWAHSMAPGASILLVEANAPTDSDLMATAVTYARNAPGVVAVTMSFGRTENSSDASLDSLFSTPSGHTGVTFLASTGDSSEPGFFPAYSPSIVAVGGTTLTTDGAGNYISESGWSGSGGGISTMEAKPAYQNGVVTQSTTSRTIPDVAFDADPYSGVSIYDSYDFGTSAPWYDVGGTSLSSPCWAGLIAVADQGRTLGGAGTLDGPGTTLAKLYSMPASNFHDVTSGSNGYPATAGYDLVTGRGSPVANSLLSALTSAGPYVTTAAPQGLQSTAPSSISFNFSATMNPTSFNVTADVDSFTGPGGVNFIPSITGYSWLNSNTTLQVNFTPVSTQGTYTMVIGPQILSAAGAAMDQNLNSVPGEVPADEYTTAFGYDVNPLQVVSTTPASGSYVNGSTATVSVSFNQPIDPTTALASNLQLSFGTVTGVTVLAGNTTVQYTLANLTTEGTLSVSIAAGALKDVNGNPLITGYSGSFIIDNQNAALPVPFSSAAPLGSQVYSSNVTDALQFASDTHSYSVTLDANQKFTIVGTAAATLRETAQLLDPTGNVLASATATTVGQSVVLQSVPITATGVYTVVITGAGSTFGTFSISATLNAAMNLQNYTSASSNTLATAQSINSAILSVGGGGQHAAVLGANLPAGSSAPVFADTFENGVGGITIDNTLASGLWHLSTGRGSQSGHSATHSLYFGQGESATGGGTYNTGSRTAGYATTSSMNLPSGSSSLSFSYVLQTEKNASYDLAQVQISTNGGSSYTLLKSYNSVAEASAWTATTIDLSAYASKAVKLRWMFDSVDGILNSYEGWYIDDLSVSASQTVVPNYYSVSLNTGDSLTLALKSTSGAASDMKLLSSTGVVLAQNPSAATGLDEVIADFKAPAAGTYYIVVTGSNSSAYDLVITKNADFSTAAGAGNTSAQPVLSSPTSNDQRVLGHIASGIIDSYAVTLTAGSVLNLSTSTPGGNGGQFPNSLDPQLRVLSPGGIQVALDDNSAGDGKNADIQYTPTATGTYYVQVSSTTASVTTGDYVLDVNGASVSYPAFGVSSTTPVTGSNLSAAPTQITVTFNQPIYLPSLLASDLQVNGAVATSVTVIGSSTAVFTLPASTAAGINTFSITAGSLIDLQGVPVSSFSGTYHLPTPSATPGTPLLSPGSDTGVSNSDGITSLNNSSGKTLAYTVTGTVSGATVTVYAGVNVIGSAVATGITTTVITSGTLPLSDGSYSVTATQITPGNTTSAVSANSTLQILTVSPLAPIAAILQATSDSGISNTDGITNVTTPAFTISASPYFRVYQNNVLVSSNYASGIFTAAPLPDGTYSFTVTSVDAAGNESAKSPPKTVTIITALPPAPAAPLLQASSDSGFSNSDGITNVNTPVFVLSTTPYYRLYRNNTLISSNYATGTFTSTALADGTYNFAVTTVDSAGNESAKSFGKTVVILTAAPAAPPALLLQASSDSGFSNNDGITNVTSPVYNVSASPYYRIYNGGMLTSGAYTSGTTYTIHSLPDGGYPFYVTAVDVAGNESAKSPPQYTTIDTIAPAAPAAPLVYNGGSGLGGPGILIGTINPTLQVTASEPGTMYLTQDSSQLPTGQLSFPYNGVKTIPAGSATALFSPPLSYAVGTGSTVIRTADVNGDGNLDLIVGSSDGISVLLGRGNGTFQPAQVTAVASPTDFVTGDFNSDGKLDLLTLTSGALSLVLGNGDGTFQSAIPITLPSSFTPSKIIATDLNGDGRMDVVVDGINSAGFGVITLLNNGDGTFTQRLTAISGGAYGMYAADLNGDGHQDLAIAAGSSIQILLGNGDGTFTTGTPISAISSTQLITGGDMNGDGKIDLVTAPNLGTHICVFENSGSATFTLSADVTGPNGPDSTLVVGDFNGDGRLDIGAAAYLNPFGLEISYGNGDGTISQPVPYSTGAVAVQSIAIGDFDHDGHLDVAEAFGIGGTVQVLLSQGGTPIAGVHTYSVRLADLAGNISASSPLLTLTIDPTVPPTPTTPMLLEHASDTGFSNTDGITKSRTPTFDLTGGPYFQIFKNGLPIGTVNSGHTFTVSSPLADGTYFFSYCSVTAAGNSSGLSPYRQITIANQTPATPVAPILETNSDTGLSTSDGITSVDTPTFDMTGENYYRFYQDGVLVSGPYGLYSAFTSAPLADGTYTFTYQGVDSAGNVSAIGPGTTVTIQTAIPSTPVAPVLQPASDTGVSNSDGITNLSTLVFNTPSTPYFRVYRNGSLISGAYATGSTFTASSQLAGSANYTISTVDAAGNVSLPSPADEVTIDTTAPTATLAGISDQSTPVSSEVLTFNKPIAGLVPASLSLSRNGGSNLLDGTQTLTSTVNTTFKIGNLAGFTATPGNYVLSLILPGITDIAGNALVIGPTVGFTITSAQVVLDGSAGNTSFYLQLDSTGANLRVWQIPSAGGPVPLIPPTTVPTASYAVGTLLSDISITGNGSPNVGVILDESNGLIAPSYGLSFDGGTGASGDSLTVILPSTGAIAAVNATTVSINSTDPATVQYANLATIAIDGSAGDDTVIQNAQPTATLTFNGGTGNDTLTVNGGLFTYSTNPSLTTTDLTINDNSQVNFTAAQANAGIHVLQLDNLRIGPAAVADFADALSHMERSLLITGGLSLAAGATMDLGFNDAIIRGGSLAAINASLSTGYSNGAWTGTGIASTAAAQDPSFLTSLGAITNDNGNGSPLYGNAATTLGLFDGQTPALGDVLIKYTYYGDTNLDGSVDGSDYSRIDSGFPANASGWMNGDFNYDNSIDGSDYTLIDNAFNMQAATLSAAPLNQIAGALEKPLVPDSHPAKLPNAPVWPDAVALPSSNVAISPITPDRKKALSHRPATDLFNPNHGDRIWI